MNNQTSNLAETLFTDMVNGNSKLSMDDVSEMADSAIAFASMFHDKVSQSHDSSQPTTYRLKGCRACYGSGGKAYDPCKVCGGTGKQRLSK